MSFLFETRNVNTRWNTNMTRTLPSQRGMSYQIPITLQMKVVQLAVVIAVLPLDHLLSTDFAIETLLVCHVTRAKAFTELP